MGLAVDPVEAVVAVVAITGADPVVQATQALVWASQVARTPPETVQLLAVAEPGARASQGAVSRAARAARV